VHYPALPFPGNVMYRNDLIDSITLFVL
jgi:hypothetical protein